jgi:hypothetical protein
VKKQLANSNWQLAGTSSGRLLAMAWLIANCQLLIADPGAAKGLS